jgi:hypothetical protein
MNRLGVLRVLFLSTVLVTLGLSTQFAFAGAHGGGMGGGFHGGSSFGGWHGSYGGGWHAGYGYGWRGGYGWGGYGWRAGYGWGYPGWGWGWGFGVGLNFGWPYWGYYGYPYAYYAPYYPYPYYPYYPSSYYYAPASQPAAYSGYAAVAQGGNPPNGAAIPRPPAPANTITLREAVYRPAESGYGAAAAGGATYRPLPTATQLPQMRPEVQNVIRALQAMPPAARQQQINSGRYGNLSQHELELVKQAADAP